MFRRILLAVDLADEAETPRGLPEALELVTAGGGDLRLVNVQPLLPATFMEYVPADFDTEQERRAQEALQAIAAKIALPPERVSIAAASGGIYHELLREALGLERRPDRRRLASSGDVGLSARLQRQDDRAPRGMFGAGRACVRPPSERRPPGRRGCGLVGLEADAPPRKRLPREPATSR